MDKQRPPFNKITATDIIIRQKATFVHHRIFYENDLFYTHRL